MEDVVKLSTDDVASLVALLLPTTKADVLKQLSHKPWLAVFEDVPSSTTVRVSRVCTSSNEPEMWWVSVGAPR